MGMPYPGGIHLDRLAASGDPNAYRLPRPRVEGSELDFSFSGLKTAVINLLHHAEQKGDKVDIPGLAASFQHTVVDILCDHTLLAAERAGAETLVLAGGVSANSGLRREMQARCAARDLRLFYPPLELCGDNAAMVAAPGVLRVSGRAFGRNGFKRLRHNVHRRGIIRLKRPHFAGLSSRICNFYDLC